MPIKIITSPPASGKTTACLRRLLEVGKAHPHKDIWVLVPDGYQAVAFRHKLADSGGSLGVSVISFDNLLREILESTGRSVPLAPNMLGQAFIRRAVAQVFEQGGLVHYQAIREMPGFISALQARFADLKRGLVYPDTFSKYAQSQPKPVQELASIYEAYQRLIIQNNWADREGLSWLAVEFMEAHPDWQPDWPLIVLDGFDSFTQPQIKALTLLAEKVPEMVITLPGTHEMSRPAHQRFLETFEMLNELPGAEQVSLETASYSSPVLTHLEAGLGETAVEQQPTRGLVDFIEARSPAEEAREALRWLKARIVRDGFAIQNCAVIVAAPDKYRSHLRAVAEAFGMPIEFSARQLLIETPLYAAFNSLLSLTVNDFQRRLVLDVIRSPYFDLTTFGLTRQDGNVLDLLSRAQQVIGGRTIWLESLEALSQVEEQREIVEDEEYSAPRLPGGEDAMRIRDALEQFFDRITPPDGEQSLVGWITWLEDLLAELDFWQQTDDLDADVDAQAALRQLLRELVLTETVIGLQTHSYRSFLDVLGEGAGQTQVALTNRDHIQKLKVLRTVEGRGLRHDAVAVLGLSEGIFPLPQKEDPFLTEEIRQELGLESAFDRHQLGLFYQAVTRADRRLLLTRPFLSPEGEHWEASPFWVDARRLFTDDVQKFTGEGVRPLSDAGSPAEILAWATYQGSIKADVKDRLAERVERVLHGREVLVNRLADAPNRYNGSLPGEEELVGEQEVFSASRLESYLSCPHWYFAAHLLGLEAQQSPALGMDVTQRGSIMHNILEQVYGKAGDPTDLDALLKSLGQIAGDILASAPQDFGFRPTPLWQHEQAEIKERLTHTIEELHAHSAGWTPAFFEAPFGLRGAPPLQLELDAGAISLRGFIDRVDRDADGNLRIVDYKLGAAKRSNSDLEEGRRVQLPLYALAARDALCLGEPVDGFYWAINKADPGYLSLRKYGFDKAVSDALGHVNVAVRGIRNAEFYPAAPKGGCPDYCPAAAWCWAYEPKGSW